jgi:hypothetical protein
MIIPSLIKLPKGEKLEVTVEDEGMLCVSNAYRGDFQEFFKGRLTPIHPMTEEDGSPIYYKDEELL